MDVVNNHNSSLSIEETLYLIVKIYLSLEEYETAKNYASILAYNFPESEWYKKAYNLINNLDDISENKNWFEKFNPIKIFREEEENNSNNTSIQSIE